MLQRTSSYGLKILRQTVSTTNTAYLSKVVANVNIIIMFIPKYMYTCIFIFTGRFFFLFSVAGCIASGTFHFYSGFSVNVLTWGVGGGGGPCNFGMTTLAFGLTSQVQAKNMDGS